MSHIGNTGGKVLLKKRGKEYFSDLAKRRWEKARWLKRYILVEKARQKVAIAIRNGTLKRKPCVVCGKPNGEAHHDDYTKPLDVMWLCGTHHNEADKKRKKEDEEKGIIYQLNH